MSLKSIKSQTRFCYLPFAPTEKRKKSKYQNRGNGTTILHFRIFCVTFYSEQLLCMHGRYLEYFFFLKPKSILTGETAAAKSEGQRICPALQESSGFSQKLNAKYRKRPQSLTQYYGVCKLATNKS